jgi:hypothetical protein
LKEETKYRLLGTYYRVGFFGSKFGKINEQQFIYKRPKITQLSEIVSYLKEKYGAQTGCPIKILQTSAKVLSKDLSPDDCNIQITFVQPYFDELENAKRKTFVERNTKLSWSIAPPFSYEFRALYFLYAIYERWKSTQFRYHRTMSFNYHSYSRTTFSLLENQAKNY